jgi:hypothetical protein
MRGVISADIEFGPKDYFWLDNKGNNNQYRLLATCGDRHPVILRVSKKHLLDLAKQINDLLRHEEEAVVESIVGVQPAELTICSY